MELLDIFFEIPPQFHSEQGVVQLKPGDVPGEVQGSLKGHAERALQITSIAKDLGDKQRVGAFPLRMHPSTG
jgi:hypothetical protein